MEMKLKGPLVVKEERRVEGAHHEDGGEATKLGTLSPHDADPRKTTSPNRRFPSFDEQAPDISRSDRSSTESFPRPSSSNPKDTPMTSQEDQLESTRAEMGEVREENERLKTILAKIGKDYQSLQMKFFNIVQQEQDKKNVGTMVIPLDVDESELVSLSLGTSSSGQKKEEKNTCKTKEDDKMEKGLALGLDCRYDGSSSSHNIEPPSNPSAENSYEEIKEEEAGEPWPPSKILKNVRNVEDEVSQQTHVKKARVSVRARCDSPTMIDGCQWRKYGQKISKGNPCPRAYYRCTVAPACPVRKQVQRCAEDMSILITTYEGNHNHPLPISATAMASTTSAAACMLMSGSSTSNLAIGSQAAPSTTSAATSSLHGLSFGLSDNSRAQHFYLPNPTISSTHSHPTITLDLTAPQPSSAAQTSQFNRFSSLPSTFTSNSMYPSTSFNFSSSESNTMSSSWNNGYLSYGAQPFNKTNLGPMNLGRQPQDPFYQSYLQKTATPAPISATQHSLTDTIAKAITSDPSFQSALTAAITSYVGGHGTQVVGDANQNLKWGEQLKSIASSADATTGNGCASSFLTRTSSSNSNPRQGNLVFFQEPIALSSSKSSPASPVDTRENIN